MAVRTRSTLGIERLEPRVALAAVTSLAVHNDQPFARVAEPVFSGVPLPEALRLTDTDRLRVLDQAGQEVPAQFRVLGRWGGAPADRTRPIRWLEVGFAADVPARATATYTLDTAGRGSAAPRLQAVEAGDRITVTTGPARFEIDRTAFNLFRSVWLDLDRDGGFSPAERVVLPDERNGAFVQQGTTEYRSGGGGLRSVVLEEAGPLRAVVRAEGFHTASGSQLLRYVTRLTFHAGQSHVEVDHTLIEGRLAGTGNGAIDSQVATTIARAGLRVRLNVAGPTTAAMRGGRAEVHRAAIPPAGTADILQESVSDPDFRPTYRGAIDGRSLEAGERATRAWLGVADGRFGVTVTTRDFHRKQPQRLRVTGAGTVEVEFPAGAFTIRQAMGVSEQVVFWFHAAAAPLDEAERVLEGFAKDRLLAVAPGEWMRVSGALGDVPGGLPGRWQRVDAFLRDSAAAALAFAASPGASGLMHYLDMPIDRFQATPPGGPAPAPDGIAWGNSYWDPAATLLPQFARTGDRRLLSDLLFPMARHFFTTDMYDPDDPASFTAGIGGARGLAHRGLWTGDYHYLESLWDYASLTGDRRAVERGLTAARTYAFHPQFALAADQGGFQTTTRTLSQKFSTMIDAWLASGDPALRAALDTQMQEFLERRFTAEGFVTGGPVVGTGYDAEQAFMVLLGIHDTVFRYYRLTGHPRAREFVVTVPQRIAEHHRASQDPNSPAFMQFHTNVRVTRSAVGGFTVTRTTPRGNSDDFFYLESHVALGTALARAWACGAPEAARRTAEQLCDFAVPRLTAGLLDKPTAMVARRLLPGLALLTDAPPPPSIQRVIHPEGRAYRAGEHLVWQVVCSAAVGVTGRPTVPIRIGGRPAVAAYATGSGTDRLLFQYTIRPGDDASEIVLGDAVSFPDGAAIGGPAPFDAALPAGAAAGVTIDTRPPSPSGRVVGPASRRYRPGDVLSFAVRFSEPVVVSGTPRLTLRLAGQPLATRPVVSVGGSGTATLVFRYAVRPGDAPPVRRGLTLERWILGGTIGDAAGNLAGREVRPPPMAGIIVVARA